MTTELLFLIAVLGLAVPTILLSLGLAIERRHRHSMESRMVVAELDSSHAMVIFKLLDGRVLARVRAEVYPQPQKSSAVRPAHRW